MAQADSNLTTRRGFSKWLAAVGVAIVEQLADAMEAVQAPAKADAA